MGITEITDALTLAALDRAVRHQPRGTQRGVPRWALYEHLGVSSRSRAARLLRAQLAALDGTALTRGKHHGVETWELTSAGRRRLSRLRAKGELPSPARGHQTSRTRTTTKTRGGGCSTREGPIDAPRERRGVSSDESHGRRPCTTALAVWPSTGCRSDASHEPTLRTSCHL
jgi:hypothetical protein